MNEADVAPGPDLLTEAGIAVRPLYEASDLGDPDDLAARLGRPGMAPFTRGPYPRMHRDQLWTMRQYAGFGSSEDTNARYRFLLEQGQTALSVAFDLPTQLGLDAEHPRAEGEVGRVGVSIDTAEDMEGVFRDLPLGQLSVNFTINATAPIILAFYLVAAERQGTPPARLTGTLQNDILKEFLARKTFIFPPTPSMRLVADVVEYAAAHLPRFNPISVTGYHAREAGCDAVQELGLTMASAIAYADELVGRGVPFDSFAARLSFHFATTLDLFEEVAKLRAARRMWWRIATGRFKAEQVNSTRLRFFSGCSGSTLTAQQPLNNIVRSTIQCLGAVLGGAQSIHVMGYDEATGIPSEEAAKLALRTQQIIGHESGVTRTADPLGGSYYVEALTDALEARATALVAEIDALGGAVAAVEAGIPQRWIADAAYRHEIEVNDGHRVKVGVNRWADGDRPDQLRLFEVDDQVRSHQIARTASVRRRRNAGAHRRTLDRLAAVLAGGDNVMPALIDAARVGATIGELSDVMRSAFGEHREPETW